MPKQTQGVCVVVTGPSGSGKTTIVSELISLLPRSARLVTTTTRPPREGERDGIDYHFVSRDAFVASRERGEFLEWAETYGELYGSSKVELDKLRDAHDFVFATIDVQGARAYREHVPHAVIVLCWAPLPELERRLRSREGMTQEKLDRRLSVAESEMAYGEHCDHRVRCEGPIKDTVSLVAGMLLPLRPPK